MISSYADLNSLSATISAPVLTGTSALPIFATYASGTKIITYAPTLFTQVGTYSISITVSDLYLSTSYTLTVVVQNCAPVFASTTTTTISVTVTQILTFSLPSYSDPDGNAITLTTYQDG